MSVRGDFAKLSALTAKLARLTTPSLRQDLSKVVGAEALTQVQLGFRASRDPYGNAWASLALRSGKPLLDTGRLRNSFSAQVTSTGFQIGTAASYAGTHQSGATILPKNGKFLKFRVGRGRGGRWFQLKKATIPRRQMVPEGRLGPIWSEAFEKAANRFVSRILR